MSDGCNPLPSDEGVESPRGHIIALGLGLAGVYGFGVCAGINAAMRDLEMEAVLTAVVSAVLLVAALHGVHREVVRDE